MFALRLLLVGATAANAAEKTATAAQAKAMFQANCYSYVDNAKCTAASAAEKCTWTAAKKCHTSLATDAAVTDVVFKALMDGKCNATAGDTEAKCVAIDDCAAEGTLAKALLEKTAGTADLKRVKDDKGTMAPADMSEPLDKIDKAEICTATTGRLCNPCKWDTTCKNNVKIGTAAVMMKFTPDICAAAKASNGVRSATMFGAAVASMFALIMA